MGSCLRWGSLPQLWVVLPLLMFGGCCASSAHGEFLPSSQPGDELAFDKRLEKEGHKKKRAERAEPSTKKHVSDKGNDLDAERFSKSENYLPPAKKAQNDRKKNHKKAKSVGTELPPLKEKPLKLAGLEKKPMAPPLKKAAMPYVLLRTVDNVGLPQSVVFDQKRLRFYVSRLGEKAEARAGTIALLGRDGSLIDEAWVKELDQPRGMAVVGSRLLVADGKRLLDINTATGKIDRSYPVEDVFYFHDVAVSSDGRVFVTAPLSNTIYELKDGALQVFLQSAELSGPNALAINGDQMFVGSIGLERSDGGGAGKGSLYAITLQNKHIKVFAKTDIPPVASLVVDDEGNLYLTGEGGAKLYSFRRSDGALLEAVDVSQKFGLKNTAGLGDFTYISRSKEFWVPVKSNGHILVFGREDAELGQDQHR